MRDQTNQVERMPYRKPQLTQVRLDTEQVNVLVVSSQSITGECNASLSLFEDLEM